MSLEEINNILKTSYGDDLGYDSDDAEYEYYSKLKTKSNGIADYVPRTPGIQSHGIF
jgi:hypothetical protein